MLQARDQLRCPIRLLLTLLILNLGVFAGVSCAADDSHEVLDFTGRWQANIAPKGTPDVIVTLGVKQQDSTVIITHLDGYLDVARGAEIFRGTYKDLKIVSRHQNKKGEWVERAIKVNDPDDISFVDTGQRFVRATDPPASSPVCEPGNRFHVKSKYAASRGFQLNNAKKYEQSNCWYKVAAELGDPAGVQGLAYAYWSGEGVPKDHIKAAKLDLIAAEQANVFAEGELASAYANGDGVEKNAEKAAYWKAKADQQWKEIRARKAATIAEQQRSQAPFMAIVGLMNAVLGPFDSHSTPASNTVPSPPAPSEAPALPDPPVERSKAEVTITVKGLAAASDELRTFGNVRNIPEGTPFTLVYTFKDAKGESFAEGNCPGSGSGITGSQKESPGTAVLTIGSKSYTWGSLPNAKSSVWRKINTSCSRSEFGMEVSEGQSPNQSGVNTRAHASGKGNSLTQNKDWRTAVSLDKVDANDPNNTFRIALPGRTGFATHGVLRVSSIVVSGPHDPTGTVTAGSSTISPPNERPSGTVAKTTAAPAAEAPAALALSSTGAAPKKIYVLTRFHGSRVTAYTLDGKQTTPTIELGGCNCGGLAVDRDGRIYVGNNGPRDNVMVFQPDGTRVSPTLNLGIGAFGLALDSARNIYVLGNVRGKVTVKSFTPTGAGSGLTINTGIDDLSSGVAVDRSGKIYVALQNTDFVRTYDSNGALAKPSLHAGVNTPKAVAVGPDGKIWVGNFVNVTSYSSAGDRVPPTLSFSSPDGTVPTPTALTIGSDGNIYVGYYSTGGSHSRVAIFRPDGKQAAPPIVTPDEIGGIAVR